MMMLVEDFAERDFAAAGGFAGAEVVVVAALGPVTVDDAFASQLQTVESRLTTRPVTLSFYETSC